MKLAPYFIVLILGLLQGALAVKAQQKSVIITFPDDTPDTVMLEAKRTITDAGGWITHEYNLFKGFAAKASSNALQTISTASTNFLPVIEEDQVVSVNGDLTKE
ncbi:uncharacterized protein TRUGW13939_11491 [Talaromyces rugulosus]|uniref:Inhibitor I9 domain-containing protein n=1 Tax=Talaromyces rugulosus TaxID=121627 RepID=A0A7H8RDY8_TALRU|nr:uncharacterized protein TRUGW13939_11491 [Talaromyces rugulosus]QKX64317.1 hypothetical protein TRUGW13939_11491 [Talaromyces rugulosus]